MMYYERAKIVLQEKHEKERLLAVQVRTVAQLEGKLSAANQDHQAALAEACEKWESEKEELQFT